MRNKEGLLSNISKSGFVRSVFTRVLVIFITVSIIIVAVLFTSFTAEIRRSILDDRQKQLAAVENSISERMDEINSIAYNIGKDPLFYMEAVESDPKTGREMSEMLGRYLVGNSYIEHLAYCRASEPDTIYTSKGERSLVRFFTDSFGMDTKTADGIIAGIHKETRNSLLMYDGGGTGYFGYLYPLPQLSAKPLAHVLMMIPAEAVQPLYESLLLNSHGETAVYDADGREIFRKGNLDDSIDLTQFLLGDGAEENHKAASGQKYVLQKVISKTNSWTYVSILRYSDTLSGLANRQLMFIFLILLLLMTAVALMLASVVAQFKPISALAAQMAEKGQDSQEQGYVDERTLLKDRIATLRDDSEQKQKYETAFYEAEAASKAKSAFLSSMSHDIRTPMNAIVGMTAIARKHIGDQAYVDECLKKVQISSDYLLDIINNVLDMSRIEAGRIPIAEEPVVIPALMDSVVSLMTSNVEGKNQTLTVDIGELKQPTVIGDNVHIVQVFVNIISNAVKFTPEGGSIQVKVRQLESDEPRAGDYVFQFTDTGVGIPPEFIGQVFDTFSRADEPGTSRTEGTGLGMAIARKLVELMNGSISCQSELGRGTTFTVTLHMPFADENSAQVIDKIGGRLRGQGSEGDGEAVDLSGKRILLAEDNAMNREIAKRIMEETHAEITEACDGKEAADAYASQPEGYFDLIFMDIQMPVMSGYEATAAIRSMGRQDSKTVPIYAMTANTFDEDVRQVRDAGMDGHIGKPYSPQTLYAVLKKALG